ncbi:FAD-binding oxidoreductase [Bacillus sp. RG28]|uniref:FAD-binding oxidoreductase n=1 Tax=Gottfriedia endophytica TaxID=2820819 RepID=A0A940NTP7_9BACI|nr:FAD-dependent oxidoreductase [Gottfriedia endophytica]MBP0724678.1 FAD-binding oxidoreductase [Gottfriedia endophytica]
MDLIGGNLYWPTTLHQTKKYEPLNEDISCDFLIIGSGSSGSQSAYLLSQSDAKVVLVDKRKIGHGSTSGNTGLLQYSNDKPLHSFINSFGNENGVRFYRMCADAIQGLEKMSKTLPIDPEFTPRSSLYYASSSEDVQFINKEYEALAENHFPVQFLTKEDIKNKFHFEKDCALYTGGDAEINPFKFVNGLIQYASENGVQIYEDTEIVNSITTEDGVTLFTKNKQKINAKKVIIAAGYEAMDLKKEKNAILSTSFALATDPIIEKNAWFENCLIWETARPYLYIRRTLDKRIIIGGLDEFTIIPEKRNSMLIHKKELLLQKLGELFPQYKNAKAEFGWGAIFGGTHSGKPMIKEYKEFPNCYFLMGYGGNGTVYSYALANTMVDLLLKGKSANLELFKQE